MKKKILVCIVVGVLLTASILSMLPPQTHAVALTDVSVDDVECTSGSVNYDTTETFRAYVINEGNTTATDVKIGFYLDGTFRETTDPFNVSVESSTWSPEVTIHWPSDYWCHKLTAKLLVPYTGECEKWFRAILVIRNRYSPDVTDEHGSMMGMEGSENYILETSSLDHWPSLSRLLWHLLPYKYARWVTRLCFIGLDVQLP